MLTSQHAKIRDDLKRNRQWEWTQDPGEYNESSPGVCYESVYVYEAQNCKFKDYRGHHLHKENNTWSFNQTNPSPEHLSLWPLNRPDWYLWNSICQAYDGNGQSRMSQPLYWQSKRNSSQKKTASFTRCEYRILSNFRNTVIHPSTQYKSISKSGSLLVCSTSSILPSPFTISDDLNPWT